MGRLNDGLRGRGCLLLHHLVVYRRVLVLEVRELGGDGGGGRFRGGLLVLLARLTDVLYAIIYIGIALVAVPLLQMLEEIGLLSTLWTP
jgi:hypothetical protein